jgi:hypothetical protein
MDERELVNLLECVVKAFREVRDETIKDMVNEFNKNDTFDENHTFDPNDPYLFEELSKRSWYNDERLRQKATYTLLKGFLTK